MASVRSLKKDIDYLIFEIISDCFTFGAVHADDEDGKAADVISEAVSLRNDLIRRANNPQKDENNKVVKNYFSLIRKDLLTGADNLFGQLSSLSKAK